jgi:excisionase family DNA binding protein
MAKQILIWESEVTAAVDGRPASVAAKRPLHSMSRRQAARLLGCSEWTVSRLYRDGILGGWKPGGSKPRADGKASNGAVVLDAASVLAYKESVTHSGVFSAH